MPLKKASEWSADEIVWKYKYLEKHFNRPLFYGGTPTIEYMMSAINYELQLLDPERRRSTLNRMNNA